MINKINKDYIEAFKAKDMPKKNFLGLIKGEIETESKRKGEVDVESILKKIEKSLNLTNDAEAQYQLGILKGYLPDELSEEEISKNIVSYIYEEGCDNIGKIMACFNRDYKGRVNNKLVSELAKEELNERNQ